MNEDDRIAKFPSARGATVGASVPPAPEGTVRVVVTYLEMTSEPPPRQAAHRGEKLALMRAEQPTLSFYRFLYNTVGGPWSWYERRDMDDETLMGAISSVQVEIFVLYVGGVPAGFFELDCAVSDEVELRYFGLIPDFIGRGLGSYFLDCAIRRAWSKRPQRVCVNTCSLDHPHAIALYQKAGFRPYRQETGFVEFLRLNPG